MLAPIRTLCLALLVVEAFVDFDGPIRLLTMSLELWVY